MLPSEVNNVKIRDTFETDKNGNTVKVQLWSFNIGDNGPFTEKFYAGEQDTPAIDRRISERVAQLRELGVLPK